MTEDITQPVDPSPRRGLALDLLLAGRTVPVVAEVVGVCRSTVWRWTQDPAFAQELRRRRADRRCAIDEVVREGALTAARYLSEVVADENVNASSRVRAAIALLDRVGAGPAERRWGVELGSPSLTGIEAVPPLEALSHAQAALDEGLAALLAEYAVHSS